MKKAKVTEVFSSVQGEGIYAGVIQVFVRLHGCNLSFCRFCDTRPSIYREYSAQELLDRVLGLKKDCHSVSITGGEPLLQKDFLKEFLPLLRARDKKIYLETNGTLPDALKEIVDFVDIIAMDFKLPSSTGLSNFWQAHRMFLRAALAKEVFVKSVITADTIEDDVEKTRNIIAEINPAITLVLQPVTPTGNAKEVQVHKLVAFQNMCLEKLKTVKIIPQLHKMIEIR